MSAAEDNRDHVRIADTGELELACGPLTWDGEPLYSAPTVRETLFAREAFAQMRGQTALDTDGS
jgi:hypothetical protein